jgi:predicted phage terminase large subunit-like protein
LRERTRLLTQVVKSPYIPYERPPGPPGPTVKQAAFLTATERERLFGGAAGGGKTDALLMAHLMWAIYPEYNGVYFRRKYPELEASVIPRSKEWMANTDASYDKQQHLWTFPSGGRLKFAHLENEDDKLAHNSAEYTTITFDELTQFSETQYTYLFSRLRRPVGGRVTPWILAGTNPGGPGHDWVNERFGCQLARGHLYRAGPARLFLPSRLSDNPHLSREEYEENLAELDPVTRARLERGDWSARTAGGWFHAEDFDIVEVAPAGLRECRFWDLAATEAKAGVDPDWTAGVRLGKARDGFWYVTDVRRFREAPARTEAIIRQVADLDGRRVEIAMEQEPGSSGVIALDHYRRRVLSGRSFWGVRSTGDKASRARPVAAAAAGRLIRLVRGPWVREFLAELEAFPQAGVHDDQVDGLSGAFTRLRGSGALDYVREEAERVKARRTA